MKIYKVAQQNKVIAYHGTQAPFDSFDRDRAAQGVFWFSEDYSKIADQNSGANSSKFIAKVQLDVNNPAGWEEYDKYYLQQINDMGFDSIKLDDDWVIFDSNRIEILEWGKNENIT
jgi:hypothetical protein